MTRRISLTFTGGRRSAPCAICFALTLRVAQQRVTLGTVVLYLLAQGELLAQHCGVFLCIWRAA